MSQAEVIGTLVIGLSALVAFITPIIKLNSNITRLTTMLENMCETDKTRDKRLNAHAGQLDEHEKLLAKHDVEIEHLKGAGK